MPNNNQYFNYLYGVMLFFIFWSNYFLIVFSLLKTPMSAHHGPTFTELYFHNFLHFLSFFFISYNLINKLCTVRSWSWWCQSHRSSVVKSILKSKNQGIVCQIHVQAFKWLFLWIFTWKQTFFIKIIKIFHHWKFFNNVARHCIFQSLAFLKTCILFSDPKC